MAHKQSVTELFEEFMWEKTKFSKLDNHMKTNGYFSETENISNIHDEKYVVYTAKDTNEAEIKIRFTTESDDRPFILNKDFDIIIIDIEKF